MPRKTYKFDSLNNCLIIFHNPKILKSNKI